ncbi:conserved hypothetical protein, partial [Ricinus communis]
AGARLDFPGAAAGRHGEHAALAAVRLQTDSCNVHRHHGDVHGRAAARLVALPRTEGGDAQRFREWLPGCRIHGHSNPAGDVRSRQHLFGARSESDREPGDDSVDDHAADRCERRRKRHAGVSGEYQERGAPSVDVGAGAWHRLLAVADQVSARARRSLQSARQGYARRFAALPWADHVVGQAETVRRSLGQPRAQAIDSPAVDVRGDGPARRSRTLRATDDPALRAAVRDHSRHVRQRGGRLSERSRNVDSHQYGAVDRHVFGGYLSC